MFGVTKATGIIGHWPLDGNHVAGTLVRDKSRNGNDGIITVAGGGLTTGIHGEADGAYLFDGASTLIDTGTDMIGVKPLTIGIWIYMVGWGEAGAGYTITNSKVIFRPFDTSERVSFSGNWGGNWADSDPSISLDIWQYVCATRTSAGITNIYINGVLSGDANQDSGIPVVGTSNVLIGDREGGGRAVDGKIAKVRVYSYVMSPGQVARLYESYGV